MRKLTIILFASLAIALVFPIVTNAAENAICKVNVALDSSKARVSETTLGDLVADAARAALKADLALIQASQLRSDTIPVGDLTQECLAQVVLYPDESVVLVELKGEKIRAALERSLSALPQPSTAFLQVSGLTIFFDSTKLPGQRVETIKVGEEPLAPERTYRVAMPLSLTKGALGYFRIFNSLQTKETGPKMIEAVTGYVKALKVINITPGQRIRDLSARG